MQNATTKDQSKRIAQIALLETIIIQHDAAIKVQWLTLQRMQARQIRRLAEVRMQKLYLINAERAAAKAAKLDQ